MTNELQLLEWETLLEEHIDCTDKLFELEILEAIRPLRDEEVEAYNDLQEQKQTVDREIVKLVGKDCFLQ